MQYLRNYRKKEQLFLQRVYAKETSLSEARLRQYGLANLNNVLDAACGFGQWTLPLARLNQKVVATDISRPLHQSPKELIAHRGSDPDGSREQLRKLLKLMS